MTHTAEADAPAITVVIVGGNNRRRLARAVGSVLRQTGPAFELFVVDLAAPPAPPAWDDVRVRAVRLPPTATFGDARALAIDQARAAVVAFLEEHCEAGPGWLEALAAAHHGAWACIGSEIHNLNPGIGWSDAVYLFGYSTWMPPATRGEIATTAAHNSSYRKDALLALGSRLPELLVAEPLLQAALRAQGQRMSIEPGARLSHENETRLCSLIAVWWWNRSFGRIRARDARWGRAKRAAYLAASVWVPWYRWARQLAAFARRRRSSLGRFVRNSPHIIALGYLAAAGLAVGALLGRVEDDLRFTDLELRSDEER
jgi:glycosyltransferase involved in cell wall biosynthesis